MKRILLTSTALVAFAGAAAAELTLGGDAELGWNDSALIDGSEGLYYSFGLSLTAKNELDNGWKVGLNGDIEWNGSNSFNGNTITIDDMLLSLKSDKTSVYYGDTKTAAEAYYSTVTNMEFGDFIEDEHVDGSTDVFAGITHTTGPADGILRGETTLGNMNVAASVVDVEDNITNTTTGLSSIEAAQLVVSSTMGRLDFGAAYQAEIKPTTTANIVKSIMSFTVGTTVRGADLKLAYSSQADTGTSTGIQMSYPLSNGVTVKAFFVSNSPNTGTRDDNTGIEVAYAKGPMSFNALMHDGYDEDMQLNVTYAMDNGVNLYGGYRDEGKNTSNLQQGPITYVGADYSLGGGATLRGSYVDVTTTNAGGVATAADEFGPGENLKEGLTVELGFKF